MMADPLLILTARGFLAVLLVAAALHKGSDWWRTLAAVGAFRVVPEGFERAAAAVVIAAELAIGVCLMIPTMAQPAALAAAAVFAAYLALIGWKFAHGQRTFDCGCSLHGGGTVLSAGHLIRNGVLILIALFAAAPDTGRALGVMDGVQILAGTIALFLAYLSADALMAYDFRSPARLGVRR